MSNPLVGKYFIGVHDEAMRSGIVEASIDDRHYLVRFDDLFGFTDGTRWPESLAVVAIDDMVRAGRDGDDDIPPPWEFFDDIEKRRVCDAWMNEPMPAASVSKRSKPWPSFAGPSVPISTRRPDWSRPGLPPKHKAARPKEKAGDSVVGL